MKIRYVYEDMKHERDSESRGEKSETVRNIKVGHNNSEMYVGFDDSVIIMPPSTVKKLAFDLQKSIENYENDHGKIRLISDKTQPKKSTAKSIIRALYKNRKIGPKLVAINTRKKKNIPLKGD